MRKYIGNSKDIVSIIIPTVEVWARSAITCGEGKINDSNNTVPTTIMRAGSLLLVNRKEHSEMPKNKNDISMTPITMTANRAVHSILPISVES